MSKPSAVQPTEDIAPKSGEERWDALVREHQTAIAERTARAMSALQRRTAELEDKLRRHDADKPSGLRGMFAGPGATDAWQNAADRLAKVQARVERDLQVATRLAQPAVGHYEAPSMRLARRRAARLQPMLAKEVQGLLSDRAAKSAAQRAESAQVREGRPSLRA